MGSKPIGRSADLSSLRQRAEQLIRADCTAIAEMPSADIQTLVNELRVYQTELEIQNEDLRQAQTRLAEARDRYRDLFDDAPVGYLTLDSDGVIREANLTVANMLCTDRERLVAARLSDYVAREDQDTWYLHRRHVFEGKAEQSSELCLKRSDGLTFPVHLESVVSRTPIASLLECRTTLTDISERKRIERELVELREKLDHSQRLGTMGRMVAEIAHEINQPLHAIANYARGMQIRLDQGNMDISDMTEPLNSIECAAHAGANTLRSVRSLVERRQPQYAPMDINEAVKQVIALVRMGTQTTKSNCTSMASHHKPMGIRFRSNGCC